MMNDAHEHMDALINMQESDDFFELMDTIDAPTKTYQQGGAVSTTQLFNQDLNNDGVVDVLDMILAHLSVGGKGGISNEVSSQTFAPRGIEDLLSLKPFTASGGITQQEIDALHSDVYKDSPVEAQGGWYPGKYAGQGLEAIANAIEEHGQTWYPGKYAKKGAETVGEVLSQGAGLAGRGASKGLELAGKAASKGCDLTKAAAGMLANLVPEENRPNYDAPEHGSSTWHRPGDATFDNWGLHPSRNEGMLRHQEGQFDMPVLAAIASFLNKKAPLDKETKTIVQQHIDKLTS